ncbi:MAG: triose-phosphate isomerase [Ignavibacteriae bacterium]|nr:triose-phosphate isomerase [Ignavibacteriota bacterium]
MRGKIIAGNWKMNKDVFGGAMLVRELVDSLATEPGVQAVLCPPFPVLAAAAQLLENTGIFLGAQNMHFENDGAYTGEVSGSMLVAVGCTHVILGHSERRQYFGETETTVNRRVRKALEVGLTPIICIGETLDERDRGITESIVERQLLGAFSEVSPDDAARCIVAYEPVWAIGTGRNATPGQAQDVHAFLRSVLSRVYGHETAAGIILQYGGSMKPDNAFELLSQPDVDGGLIGGASLTASSFIAIVDAARRSLIR